MAEINEQVYVGDRVAETSIHHHAATFTKECLEKMSEETVQNIIDFFEKKIASTKIVKL